MQTQQWDKAVTIGQEFIRNKDKYGYDLIPDYRDLFTLKNEKHNETICCKLPTRYTRTSMACACITQ